jgi:DNA modification methylase
MQTDHRVVFASANDLSGVADASVELVVTSPPYPMIAMWDETFVRQDAAIGECLAGGDGPGAWERMHALLDDVWSECARVVRPGGFICINIGDATRTIGGDFRLFTNHSRVTGALEARGMHALPPVIWRKPANGPSKFMGSGMLPAGAYVTLEHEHILIFRRGRKRTFSPAEMVRRRRSACFWEERNEWFSDLWELRGVRQRMAQPYDGIGETTPASSRRDDPPLSPPAAAAGRERSGAFPFELAFRLISMYSSQEDVVLDPFLGTGTTVLAAMVAGRSSIGFEIDELLEAVIDASIGTARRISIERQAARLSAHIGFLAERKSAGGSPPAHRNSRYDLPVVTGQEAGLTLPVVTEVARIGPGRFRAGHEVYDPGREPYDP